MPVEGVLNLINSMQSEPRRPEIIHGDTPPKAKEREECPHIGGHVVKRAPMTSASESEGGGSGGLCCRRGR